MNEVVRCRGCGMPTKPGTVEEALRYCISCAQQDQLRASQPTRARRPQYRTRPEGDQG